MIELVCPLLALLGILPTFGKQGMRRSIAAHVLISGTCFILSAVVLGWSEQSNARFGYGLFLSDSTSRLFLALVSAVFLGVSIYVYNRARTHPFALRKIQDFVRWSLLFYCASALAILSNNFFVMWLLLEATTLAIAPLIYHQKSAASIQAAWKYFLFSGVGLGMAFLGFTCLAKGIHVGTGTEASFFFQDFGPHIIIAQPWRDLGLALLLFGFGTKLGLAPMYSWLPGAYDLSPPSVTVLLSAVQFNAVMVAVFRVFQYLNPLDSPLVRYEMIGLGLLSILASTLHIVAVTNYKRLIAFASINHAGVIAVGLGIGKSAAYGVVLYVLSNALVKAVLFLTCGNIKARFHTKSIHDIQGLIKSMPFSGTFFMIGIFALLGFAPFGSFIGEILMMKSMIDGRYFATFAFFCLMMTIAFIATGRAVFPMIWGEPKHEVSLKGESVFMLLPKLFFVFLLLSLGLYLPTGANSLLQGIAAGIGGN